VTIYDIIYRKRNGEKLSADEIAFAVAGYTAGDIPDYQMSALLMAIFIRGMDEAETAALTRAMTASGDSVDLSGIPGVKADKHSTGGVGDGTSLVVAPLAACCGVVVPMMSGRGLGHTGGTLDKLESIPGFRVNLSEKEYLLQLERIGVALIGQTERVAPADRKLYALRDVTATVDSLPLIAASIMSKKLAEGCNALVLDVKTGTGAFMRTVEDARRLAAAMLATGKACGRQMTALITDMNRPLGCAAGNALEIAQAVQVMKGGGPADFVELVLELAGSMVLLSGKEKDRARVKMQLRECLRNGQALEKFRQIVEAQGGDARVVDMPERILPGAGVREDLIAPADGYVIRMDTRLAGLGVNLLGAGRLKKEDRIDPAAGVEFHKKTGDRVNRNEPIATLYHNNPACLEEAIEKLNAAYVFGSEQPAATPLIYEEMA
jgi:pyrimidine-nucleoside phosphorylase